jgi:hypothetical protein
MKAFGNGFKPLYETGMGINSGMSEEDRIGLE